MGNTHSALRFVGILILLISLVNDVQAQTQTKALKILQQTQSLGTEVDSTTRDTGIPQLLSKISKKTGVEVATADTELQTASLQISFHAQPAYAVLDAVSALYLCRWEVTPKNKFYLLGSQRELDQAFQPRSEFQKERFAVGRVFIAAADNLPAVQKEQIKSSGIAINTLPKAMQNQFDRMIKSLSNDFRTSGDRELPLERVSEGTVAISKKHSQGFSRYAIKFNFPGAGGSFSVNDYEEYRITARSDSSAEAFQNRKKTVKNGGQEGTILPTEKNVLSQKEKTTQPGLQRRVTVQGSNMTFPQVLYYLDKHYNVPFVCDPRNTMPQMARVSIENLPLNEALDKLTTLYKDTEWEWRETGFLVVRGPNNPARGELPASRYGK